jgi:DNA-binding beta-propeller fold protein YncE
MNVGDLPLAMVESADGRFLIVSNNGYVRPSLTVVDLKNFTVRGKVSLDNAWLGLAWSPDLTRLYSSGAAANTVEELFFEKGRLTPASSLPVAERDKEGETFIGGVAASPDGGRLYAVNVLGLTLSSVDLATCEVRSAPLPAEPYTCLVPPDGKTVLVSLWGGAKVLVFDAETLAPAGEIPVGEHPNAMALSPGGERLFVACANTNAVWVVDLPSRTATEQIAIALYPNAPPGSTPNGLGLSPDGSTLLVANADNNSVAVADVSRPGKSRVAGFLPSGWYPTGAAFSRDGSRIFVLSGKGLTSSPNPRGRQPAIPEAAGQYIGALLQGSLSVLPAPGAAALAAYTRTVYALTPYSDASRLKPARAPRRSPVPRRVAGASPIKHVFYIIRENRTYDQVLGDMPEGNGDPNLCLFGDDVTPNAHALAREFVLLDNFYVNAEVSYDGHAYSTGAYATDFVEKVWPMNYALRGGRSGERLHLGRLHSRGGFRPELRRVRRGSQPGPATAVRQTGRRTVSVGSGPLQGLGPGAGRAHRSGLPPLRPVHPRRAARGGVAEGIPGIRKKRNAALSLDSPPRRRPHRLYPRRLSDAAFHDRGKRPGAWEDRRGHFREPVLEGFGDLRCRGRRAERAGSRGRAPLGCPRREPLDAAARRGLDAADDLRNAAHDRAHPGNPSHEPVRRVGDADVQRL